MTVYLDPPVSGKTREQGARVKRLLSRTGGLLAKWRVTR